MHRALTTLFLLLSLLAGCAKPPLPEDVEPKVMEPQLVEPPDPTSLGAPDLTRATTVSITRTDAPAAESGPPKDPTTLFFLDEQTGFAGTWSGAIAATADGGQTWREHFRQEGTRFIRLVFAPDGRAGMAIGQTGCDAGGDGCQGITIARTADGGQTWQPIAPEGLPAPDGPSWWDIQLLMPSAEIAYIASQANTLLKTVDGGQTWQPVALPDGLYATGGIHFFTPDRGYVSARKDQRHGIVLATADGGKTWRRLWEGDVPIRSIQFTDEQHGYIGGGHGHWKIGPIAQILLTTEDGGLTWQERYRNEDYSQGASPITRIHFYSETDGWAEQEHGPLLSTADGGRTWTPHLDGRHASQTAVVGPRLWMAWSGTIFHTTDGGRHWEPLYQRAGLQPQRIQFVTPDVGFLTTQAGIFRTVDGGGSWVRTDLEPRLQHHPVTFASASVAFRFEGRVFGLENRLLRSADGGRSWSPVLAGLEEPRLSFPTPETGFLVSPNNCVGPQSPCPDILMTTTDGGLNWTRLPAAMPIHAFLAFADERHGVAAGGHETKQIVTTADGGQTWLTLEMQGVWFRAVDYTPGGHIWIGVAEEAGQRRGLLLHSPDRGATWEVFELKGVGEQILGLEFTSPTDGWLLVAIGREPVLARTRDGGKSWEQVWP